MRPTLSRPWAGLVIGRGTFDGTELVPKFSKNVSSPGLVAARHMMLCFKPVLLGTVTIIMSPFHLKSL